MRQLFVVGSLLLLGACASAPAVPDDVTVAEAATSPGVATAALDASVVGPAIYVDGQRVDANAPPPPSRRASTPPGPRIYIDGELVPPPCGPRIYIDGQLIACANR